MKTAISQRLAASVEEYGAGKSHVSSDARQLDLVLGITCHGVYHAGQLQLIKRLHGG